MRHLPLVPTTLYPKMLETCLNENRVYPHDKEIPSKEQLIDTDKDIQ